MASEANRRRAREWYHSIPATDTHEIIIYDLAALLDAVVAEEREACIEIVHDGIPEEVHGGWNFVENIARRIRERGKA